MGKSKRSRNIVMTNLVTGSDKLQRNGLVARKKARLEVEETRKRIFKDTSAEVRADLEELQNDFTPDVNNQDDWVDDPAMADAGLFQDEGFTNEQVLKAISSLLPKPRKKSHIWGNRMTRLHTAWTEQLDDLATLYLHFKTTNTSSTPSHHHLPQEDVNCVYVECLDIFDGRSFEYLPRCETDLHPTYALVRAGYLPPTPREPQIAISLRSLELLYSLFRAAPSFSMQHFARLFSDMHKVMYQPYLRTQMSLAFDVFYRILSHLDKVAKRAIGQAEPDYRLRNSCPACHYRVEDEPERPIQFIVTADGNNSLSRLRHNFAMDARMFLSDYFIPREQVNNFAGTQKHSRRDIQGRSSEFNDPSLSFIPDSCLAWKNARPMPSKSKSGSAQLMDETGLFSVICRHGIVQFLIDMVQSGELAKYPLAAADQLIRTFGNNILLVYDIGCTFSATLSKSSIGNAAQEANFKCCTGSFHGAAHNRLCQLDFLISLQKGAGIEDGEGNEPMYSESNSLAPITRHASPYYRHLRIHMHFMKWDEIKYERLGDFFLNNYTAAWRTMKESLEILDTTKRMVPDFDPDRQCPQWLDEEREYISSLQVEPEDEKAKVLYLEATEHLERAEETVRYWIAQIAASTRLLQHADRHLREANEAVESARSALSALELVLPATVSRTQPWIPGSPERLEAIGLRQQRDYNRLLDELEHRAISRQFEVEKMGLPRTDYKARQQILSLVAKRGKTLGSTLDKYNALAATMDPPKPRLSWEDVTSLEFVSDIVVLQGRDDVRKKPWAKPLLRNATRAWYKLQRAHEEIETVNLEARRVWASIKTEEISIISRYRLNVNAHLRAKLAQLDKRAGVEGGPRPSAASVRDHLDKSDCITLNTLSDEPPPYNGAHTNL